MAFLPIIGAVASAGGALLGGISQANAASYRAKVASNNAMAENQNATYAAKASAVRTEQEGLKAAQRLSGVEAGLAANNVEAGSGSAADVQESQHAIGMEDVATVANQGALAVYGYKTQAKAFTAQEKADRAEVLPDIIGGALGAVGALGKGASAGAFGGGSGGSGAAVSETGDAATLAETGGGSSLPSNYQWMRSSSDYNSGLDGEFSY